MNKLLVSILLAAALCACAHQKTHREDTPVPPTVDALADVYESLSEARWPDGWAETDHCDALLWASLRAASGVPALVEDAEASPGEWRRRPTSLPECYASGGSTSTISRDMLVGVMWWAWTARRADIVREMWEYAVEHGGRMGSGRLAGADTLLNPNMWTLLAKLCVRMDADCGGASVGVLSHATTEYTNPQPSGFERHLELLQILLLGEVDGGLPPGLVSRLARHRSEQPGNPLAVAAAAVYGMATPADVDATLSPAVWPSGALPTSADRCATWATEQEFPGPVLPAGAQSLQPCPEDGRTHTGGEILFIRRILRGRA